MEIIGEIQKHQNARVFAFGIGGSVNRFLLDNMAKYGRGEVEYVALADDGAAGGMCQGVEDAVEPGGSINNHMV